MKPEKELESKRPAIETERSIEAERQEKSLQEIKIELEDTKNRILLDFKKMVDQKVARFDFQKNKNGEIESVTITRILTGETLFHANNKDRIGEQDIKRVMGLMSSEQIN